MTEKIAKQIRTFIGAVLKANMTKTIVVAVERFKLNTKYNKKYKVVKKYHVHDEKNTAKVGDKVTFVECRPMSKTKRWKLVYKA